jgi:UDP-N-acetylglucosamine 4,6-dehydratase
MTSTVDPPVEKNTSAYLKDKVVIVTGAAGTIGSALVEEIAKSGARSVRAIDHGESELFYLYERLRGLGNISPMIGDIRDRDRLRLAFQGADIVFHTAALKHVELGEYNPFEVVETNLTGLNNVIRAALDVEADRVIFTSSDKAVHPTNVMGASKMMGERLVTAANEIRGTRRTIFSSVRFGNVLGSRGSVVPIFAEAALRGQALMLTHPEMTRYVMTISDAARLVVEAGSLMRGGEVFVTKMKAIRIADLAQVIAEELTRGGRRSEITQAKIRPGEKLYEELLTTDELPMAFETDRMLMVLAAREGILARKPERLEDYGVELKPVDRTWHSGEDKTMSIDELRRYLLQNNVLAPWRRA